MEWIPRSARRLIERLASGYANGHGSSIVDCASSELRDEFWRRLDDQARAAASNGAGYHVAINPFEVRRWRLKVTAERRNASVTAIVDEAPVATQLVLAMVFETGGTEGAKRTKRDGAGLPFRTRHPGLRQSEGRRRARVLADRSLARRPTADNDLFS
jgi:hypothetical protein